MAIGALLFWFSAAAAGYVAGRAANVAPMVHPVYCDVAPPAGLSPRIDSIEAGETALRVGAALELTASQ
jgi:hypothetical protein